MSPSSEAARLRRHFTRALAIVGAADDASLPVATRRRRRGLVRVLEAYAARGRFPENDRFARRTPFFVDAQGTRCAMAHIIDASGHGELVEQIAERSNHAYVRELARIEALRDWLRGHGFTAYEAARIQPTYSGAYWDEQRRQQALAQARVPTEFCVGAPFATLIYGRRLFDDKKPFSARIEKIFAGDGSVAVGDVIAFAAPKEEMGDHVLLTRSKSRPWSPTDHYINALPASQHGRYPFLHREGEMTATMSRAGSVQLALELGGELVTSKDCASNVEKVLQEAYFIPDPPAAPSSSSSPSPSPSSSVAAPSPSPPPASSASTGKEAHRGCGACSTADAPRFALGDALCLALVVALVRRSGTRMRAR
jgi:hypothetical protein